MIDYKDLKNGDVIAMIIEEYDEIRIVIVDRVENSATDIHKLYTYAEMEKSSNIFESSLFLEKDEPGYSYNLNDCVIRYAEDEEKIDLYDAIGKHFTEEYDKNWYKHFTDSSYFDIQDYLLDVFCIKVNENDDDLLIPDFVGDIQNHIWDGCCKALGVSNEEIFTEAEESKDKMVSLDKVCTLLKSVIDEDVLVKCGSVIKCMGANDFSEYVRKAMEE